MGCALGVRTEERAWASGGWSNAYLLITFSISDCDFVLATNEDNDKDMACGISHLAPCFKKVDSCSARFLLMNSSLLAGYKASRLAEMMDGNFPVYASDLMDTDLNFPAAVATMRDGCLPYTSEYGLMNMVPWTIFLAKLTCTFLLTFLVVDLRQDFMVVDPRRLVAGTLA